MTGKNPITEELEEISPQLAHLTLTNPYRVPAGYFEGFAGSVLAKIELEEVSPLLSSLKKSMPYSLPAGYFEKLAVDISAKADVPQQAKVISFSASKVFRYAAAAVVVGVIAISGWLFLNKSPETVQPVAQTTNTLSETQIENRMTSLSDSEINNFIDGNALLVPFTYTANNEQINDEDVALMLADIPDLELEKYIDRNTVKEKFN